MTHFGQSAPTSPTRVHDLHDQSLLPATPHKTRAARLRLVPIVITAIIFAVIFTAIGVQIRAGWESHRDWVVPMIAQGAAIAAVAAAYLVVRGRTRESGIGFILLILTLAIVGANFLRGTDTEGPDTMRDWFSIISAILFGASMISFIVGWLYVELRDPTRPKSPEL